MQIIVYILGYCSAASSLMPLRMSYLRKLNTIGYRKRLHHWIILSVIGESLSTLIHILSLIGIRIDYPAAPLHLFTLIEATFIIWLFYSYFNDSSKKMVANGLIVGIVIFELIQIIFVEGQGLQKMNSNTRALEGIIVISLVIYFFYQTLETLRIQRLVDSLMFWVSVAFLLYFSGNLFSFILSSTYTDTNIPIKVRLNLSTGHSILNILKNILITIGIWRMNSSD